VQEFHKDEISKVKNFFGSPESNICVIHGSKGSGKTYMMSKIANEVILGPYVHCVNLI